MKPTPHRRWRWAVVLTALALAPVSARAELADAGPAMATTPEQARADVAARVRHIPLSRWTIIGRKPWLFWSYELRHLSHARFWGPDAARASVAKSDPDPLKAIVAYHRMLESVGVELLVVPVPTKVSLYGEYLDPPVNPELFDAQRADFLRALTDRGVHVVDILPDLRALKASGHLAFLPRDTHWTSAAVRRVAAKLGRILRAKRWYVPPKPRPKVTVEHITTEGYYDLPSRYHLDVIGGLLEPERVDALQVKLDGKFVENDPKSPVVLAGDSFTVVFHSLLTEHGGLADHLTGELGYPIDQVGLAGEGAVVSSWAALARRKDNLAGKKVVIFCFSERNLTVEEKGWPVLPVVRTEAPAVSR